MKANRLVLLGVAAATLVLSGCTQTADVAARVGDTTVTTSEVDFLTKVQCASLDNAAENPQGQPAQTLPTSRIRTEMLNTLVQAELNRQLAAEEDLTYDKDTLREVMGQFEATLEQVPEGDRDRFRDLVEEVYRGQLQVYGLAEFNLKNEGVTAPDQAQVQEAVGKLQEDFRKGVDIEVNPEYGADADGVAGAVDPSLSIPVSSFAKDSRSGEPEAGWLDDLPADQKCG